MSDALHETIDVNGVIEFWRSFDLDGNRQVLDKQVLEMREAKANSLNGRKRLNAITKTFRSRDKDEQVSTMTEVLKAYQEEIDQLVERCKFSEQCFYKLYKSMYNQSTNSSFNKLVLILFSFQRYDAPDPSQTIERLHIQISNVSSYQVSMQ